MHLLIAGGTGFLGQALENYFHQKGHTVTILTRKPRRENHIAWDAQNLGAWAESLEEADVLINLTGKSVDCRYTEANRRAILQSRMASTNILHRALEACENPPKVWLNASSATIYVHAEAEPMTEAKGVIGDDFSMRVCKAWEACFFEKKCSRTRQVALRTSIVLGNSGGAYPKLRTVTRWGLGGVQGDGRQWVSWIHELDFCRAVEYCIEQPDIAGAINITGPQPVRNRTLMAQLRNRYRRPFGLSAPQPLLELGTWLLQTESELLLKSRHVFPERLEKFGFTFDYASLPAALQALA